MDITELNAITSAAVSAALRIHAVLGPGLLESVYEAVLARDLIRNGFRVERQKEVSFSFEGLRFENALKVDLLVEEAVVIELKSVAVITAVHEKQLLTYVKLLDVRLGLLLNFGAPLMKDGIKRMINGYDS
jgi:iron complex transport system substrate-binding protein